MSKKCISKTNLFELPAEIIEKIEASEKKCLAFYKKGVRLHLIERDSSKYAEKTLEEIKASRSYLDEFIAMTENNIRCFEEALDYFTGLLEDLKAISGLISALGAVNITQIYIEQQQKYILNEIQKRVDYITALNWTRMLLSR